MRAEERAAKSVAARLSSDSPMADTTAAMTYVVGNLRRLIPFRKKNVHLSLPKYAFATDGERLTELPSGYVTFSLDTHSRQEALEWIRTSDHRHYLAIYDPKTRVTVTGGYAMEQKD